MRTLPMLGAAAALLVVLVGCAPGALDVEDETVGGSSPSPSTAPSPPPAADAAPVETMDTSDWRTYSTHDGDVTYRYPSDWVLESDAVPTDADGSRPWHDHATLTAPNGQQLLQSSDFVDLGGSCGPDYQFPIEVLAVEPAAVEPPVSERAAQIVSVAVGTDDGRYTFGVGISSSDLLPEPGSTGCGWRFVHGSSAGGISIGTHFSIASIESDPLWTVDTLDEARAYMETDEYATLLEILRSVQIA